MKTPWPVYGLLYGDCTMLAIVPNPEGLISGQYSFSLFNLTSGVIVQPNAFTFDEARRWLMQDGVKRTREGWLVFFPDSSRAWECAKD